MARFDGKVALVTGASFHTAAIAVLAP